MHGPVRPERVFYNVKLSRSPEKLHHELEGIFQALSLQDTDLRVLVASSFLSFLKNPLRGSPFSDDMPGPVTSETPVLLVLPSLPGVCSHGEREEGWRQEAQRARNHRKYIPGRHRAFDKRDVG